MIGQGKGVSVSKSAAKEKYALDEAARKFLYIAEHCKAIHKHLDGKESTNLTDYAQLTDLDLVELNALLNLHPELNIELSKNTNHPTFSEILQLNRTFKLPYLDKLRKYPEVMKFLDSPFVSSKEFLHFISHVLPQTDKVKHINAFLANQDVHDLLQAGIISYEKLILWKESKLRTISKFSNLLVKQQITVEEAFAKGPDYSQEEMERYVKTRITNVWEISPHLKASEYDALSVFNVMHLNKFFNNPRKDVSLHAVLNLTDAQRIKLANMPSHLYSLYFAHDAFDLKQLIDFSASQIKFVERALKNHNQKMKLISGVFRREPNNGGQPFHDEVPLMSESTPLLKPSHEAYPAINFGGEIHIRLKHYVNRIDNLKFYANGFGYFFRDSRAANREANHMLAQALLAQIEFLGGPDGRQATEENIQTIFSKENIKLFRPVPQHNHGINSSELKSILKDAQKHIVQEHRAAARR